MKYNELTISTKKPVHRVGRGIAAGQGKTAGRGTKGQNSRTGSKRRPGFEGGSNPLLQRLPKLPGFKSHRTKFSVVYTGQINKLTGKVVDNELLTTAGLVPNKHLNVKLIVQGEIGKAVNVKLQAASQSAIKAVEAKGGSFTAVEQIGRVKVEKK